MLVRHHSVSCIAILEDLF